jgi:transposase
MQNTGLFGDVSALPVTAAKDATPSRLGKPRLRTAVRNQIEVRVGDLDSTIPADDRARAIWDVVVTLDLSKFLERIKSREGGPGADATDPRILLGLWLLGLSDGIGIGREIHRLTEAHDAYRWMCGKVQVDADTLNDFRRENGAELDQLVTQVLGALTSAGLVTLDRIAQDGTKVRACAGAASFRSEASLEQHIDAAFQHVKDVVAEAEKPGNPQTNHEKAAREHAAVDRAERVLRAQVALDEVAALKRKNGSKTTPRASTTDPDARVMKMPDGGYRPAFNVQFATDVGSRVTVGVYVTNAGNDFGELLPMGEEIKRRTGKLPPVLLVDGGYAARENIEEAANRGTTVYSPVPEPPRDKSVDKFAPNAADGKNAAEWRARMATPEAQAIFKLRGQTAELPNADAKDKRGLDRFRVKGLGNALAHVLLVVLTQTVLIPAATAVLRLPR